ncbi:periplasmic nitrate reductase small subunit (cytochrome c-type protein) [Sulfuricurvum kujiense DSM 16994]|uniref:Periplasmic nitrate reductase, electron transfer subunit n=1 Tax=Sulfuricurvum kujiense (strain ATCC BAA-921 / DSM 16994 / JCM 11577 / YK-1) TaxID=709032 RepID=E4U150_SULKY|nr:nitrate reductase cytochrome c-type subunit [Sulfuricurvum kujiense]ADR33354.1 periplasmic nitrate reductase small subunit (cytochrome c-type protein) [Sulfuricurvum kujiense DSM 16994]
MKRKVIGVVTALVLGTTWVMGASKEALISDESLGLCKVSVEADSGLKEKPYVYKGTAPGAGNKRIPRAYDNCPPMIPHDINELPIITQEENSCISCHMPDVASSVGAIAIPKTHMTNLRNMKDLKGELYQGRWNCTQCHAPQAELDPAVMNRFKGAYRKKIGGEYKTNLIQTLREGVLEDKSGSFDLDKDLLEE